LNYNGKVYFSDTKYFKWQYVEPTQKEVCTDGVELLVVDHDLEQVSSYYIVKGLDISKILQKATKHSKNIYVALYENKKYTIQIDSKKRLQSIAYFDNLDNKVQIVFKHIKYRKNKFSSKVMHCNYPNEYDMIKG
jgi:outer membrane lipoprotein carrier protein